MAEPRKPYDAGDEAQVAKRRNKAQIRRDQEKADLSKILDTDEGKRFVWRLLGVCGIHRDPFNTNALAMAAQVGEQRVGRWIETEIAEACPCKFLEMQLMSKKEDDDA